MSKSLPSPVDESFSVDWILEQACIRNARLELHHEQVDGGLVVAHTRALELTGRNVVADTPTFFEEGEHIPVRRPATAHFQIRGQRFQFTTRIESNRVRLADFGRHRGTGITLRRPRHLVPSQRRAHVRVSLHASAPIRVWMAQVDGTNPTGCQIDATHFVGHILNLSGGGASVLVEDFAHRRPEPGERYFLSFHLPGCPQTSCLLGSVRHIRMVTSSDSYRVAFAFKPWSGSSLKRNQQEILRFIVEQERAQLRRR